MARLVLLSDLITRAKARADKATDDHIADSEWKACLSNMLGVLHVQLNDTGARLFETRQTISTVASTFATGTITHVAKDSLVDGETFTLHDGYGPITFEFDLSGGVLVAGNVRIDVSSDTSANDVEDRTNTAINAATHWDGTAFKITAASGGSGISSLTNDVAGSVGNQRSSESVASTSFAITDMAGGGGSYRVPPDYLSTVRLDYVVNTTTGERRPLTEIGPSESHRFSASGTAESVAYEFVDDHIHLWPFPPGSQTYWHTYVRQPLDISSAPTSAKIDCLTADGEEFLLWAAAAIALHKEESEFAMARAERDAALERIKWWAIQNKSQTQFRPHFVDELDAYLDPAEYHHRFYKV